MHDDGRGAMRRSILFSIVLSGFVPVAGCRHTNLGSGDEDLAPPAGGADLASRDDLTGVAGDMTIAPADMTIPADIAITPADMTVTPADMTITPTDMTVIPADM